LTKDGSPPTFVGTERTIAWLSVAIGAPAANVPIRVVAEDGIAAALWETRGWALVPFDRIERTMKILTLDGLSVFDRALNMETYPFSERFTFIGDDGLVALTVADLIAGGAWIPTNRDLSQMTIVVMTGVTALVRAIAWKMELNGINMPAQNILPFFADADYVHTSNEVSFVADCPYPDPSGGTTFCSRDSYFELLTTIRLNVVELTGNHVKDYGTEAFVRTLDMYKAANMTYFGGGYNQEDARKAALIAHNGNVIAFIGCNSFGPNYAWAEAEEAGSAQCDDEFLKAEIARLTPEANVIMTLQYTEYYQYAPPVDQITFFRKYADMGADLVMGSQAHQPQGFAYTPNAFIHYGVGNLFFDQMQTLGTRQMFADKLIFYQNQHINTILFTGINEDYSRVRPMTAEERTAFLTMMFEVSGW
jgi:hypothetical protein